jgi:hypothetical protein
VILRRDTRRLGRRAASGLLALSIGIVLLAAQAGSARASGFDMGFSFVPVIGDGFGAQPWVSRAVAEGSQTVRISVIWRSVAPVTRPPGFVESNPASPGYYWAPIDAKVRAYSAAGVRVVVVMTNAPVWAQGPGAPATVFPGTWKPNPSDIAQFGTALALRYSGHFPDPLQPGRFLPRVGYWQGWNEPNLTHYLAPQWVKTAHGFQANSPDLYRPMANAFYSAVKAVSKSNVVLMAGTAPWGDPIGGLGMRPMYFWRHLLCLTTKLTPLPSCPGKVHYDITDHHSYDVIQPTHAAINADDVTIPDLYKVAKVVRAGVRFGRILPKGNKPLWADEFSWDSNPPDPHGVSLATQATWLEQAFYLLWRQGVSTALWFVIADAPPVPSYSGTYQAGTFFLNGQAKPSALAFRFPLVASRPNHSHVFVWGRAPSSGRLRVERAVAGGSWKVLRTLRVHQNGVFTTTLKLRGGVSLRAQVNGLTSLTWNQPR